MTYRGTVVAYDSGAHTATIRLDGGPAQVLEDIPVSRAIPTTGEIAAGDRVIVDTGDADHPDDFLVTAVYA